MVRAFSLDEVAFFHKRFVAYAVEAFVLSELYIFLTSAPQLLCSRLVVSIRCADKMESLGESKLLLQLFEFFREFVHIRLRVLRFFLRFTINLQPMLISASVEKNLIPLERTVARNDI